MNTPWQTVAEEAVRQILQSLPSALQAHARTIPVLYELRPTPAMQLEGVAPDSLGLFVGTTYAEQQEGVSAMPAEILLFIDNIRADAESNPREFRHQVRITYLHELGHYLGLAEGELSDRDLE